MKIQKSKKKPLIILLSVLLAVVIVISSAAALLFVLSKQDKAKVIDKTEDVISPNDGNNESDTQKGHGQSPSPEKDQSYADAARKEAAKHEDVAVFSSSVELFTDESAEEVNDSVVKITKLTSGVSMEIADGSDFETLGIGDIFFLDGDEDSPFMEPYIGKIVSVDDGEEINSYVIETPQFDEVFDVLKLEGSTSLTADNLVSVEAMPGVTYEIVDDSDAEHMSGDKKYSIGKLGNIGKGDTVALDDDEPKFEIGIDGDVVSPGVVITEDAIRFNLTVDLLEAFGLNKDSSVDFQEVYDEASNHDTVNVYTTSTGSCYHRESCPCVTRSIFEVKLKEACDEGFSPCFLCNPPIYKKEGMTNADKSLELKGSLGLENLDVVKNINWDILSADGLQDLSFFVTGKVVADVRVEANGKFEFGGATTGFTAPLNILKTQGLDQKTFPLFFLSYDGKFNTTVIGKDPMGKGANDRITAMTSAAPISIGLIVYVDVEGNVSLGATVGLKYEKSFSAGAVLFEKGKWVGEFDGDASDGELTPIVEIEAKGDADIHFGCSLNLYVFNVNPLEIALMQTGAEAEGSFKVSFANAEGENPFSGSFHARAYLKLLGVNFNIKANLDIVLDDLELALKGDWLWKDITIAEWGTKNPTRFTDSMSYTHITADDGEAVYYKDTDGALVKETDSERLKLYTDGFFSICGIDSSYIYLLRHDTETGNYEMFRVSKSEAGISKKIADDVVNCLTFDSGSIYYIESFNKTQILKLDRNSLEDEVFCDLDTDVVFMEKQDDNFYVMRENDSAFASFFGGGPYCMLVDPDGNVIEDYGDSPSVEHYSLNKFDNYIYAVRLVSNGYLRNSASEVRWLSPDKSSNIVINCAPNTGWNPLEEGIFTVEQIYSPEYSYKLVFYRAEDGSKCDVTNVSSGQSLFTVCHSESGDWYFFDQTSTELILYRMNADFSVKTVVKTFDLSTLNVNLTDCSMKLVNNRIYFYTMPNAYESTVLYRYDLV